MLDQFLFLSSFIKYKCMRNIIALTHKKSKKIKQYMAFFAKCSIHNYITNITSHNSALVSQTDTTEFDLRALLSARCLSFTECRKMICSRFQACHTRTGPRRARYRSTDMMPLIQSLQDMPMIVFMQTGWLCLHPQKLWTSSIAKDRPTLQKR